MVFVCSRSLIDIKNSLRESNPSLLSSLFLQLMARNAEVGQLIAGIKFGSILTADMASKNDAWDGIGFSYTTGLFDVMPGIVF